MAKADPERALSTPGKPLEARSRSFLESRFGRDFGDVRVHEGGEASLSARALGAKAYTSGTDIVFGEGEYKPSSESGRRLLAHELTHVVQQSGGAAPSGSIQRKCACGGGCPRCSTQPIQTKLPVTSSGDRFEQEADRVAGQVMSGGAAAAVSAGPASIQRDEDREIRFFDDPLSARIPEHMIIPMGAPPEAQLELPPMLRERPSGLSLGTPPLTLAPMPTPALVIRVSRCDPDRPLTWADFQATPAAGTFSAETSASITKQSVGGQNMYRAIFDPARSWVRPLFGDPTNRATNNCGGPVTQCETFFTNLPAGNTGTVPFRVPASATCPASATLAQVTATSFGECESVIGSNCDATRQTESDRLLAHEQGHFDITCVFANKANDALLAGSIEAAIDRTLTTKLNAAQRQYDAQTRHGCNAGQQASWEADIAAGLPSRTIP